MQGGKIPSLGWPGVEKGLMENVENVLSVRMGRSGMFVKRQGEGNHRISGQWGFRR